MVNSIAVAFINDTHFDSLSQVRAIYARVTDNETGKYYQHGLAITR
jgi:hypothetical protein